MDFIAIGDIVIDAFIKLKNAEELTNHGTLELCLPFAEKVPYEEVYEVPAVGNASNAAVVAARLGLKSALVSNLGSDQGGQLCLETLKRENVATDYVSIQEGAKTNYHYVLWFEADRTILVKHEKYERKLPDIGQPKWLYLSSLGKDALDYHLEILKYLKLYPEIKLAFQPGTFQIAMSNDLKGLYERANIFFCNVEEAERILGINTLGIQELLKRMHAFGPKVVVITDGPKGAHAYDGANFYNEPPYPDPKPPLERTGAGDAFSSTVVAALELGQNLQTALKWGAVNSAYVVQEVGAQKGLLTRAEIEKYLK